MKVGFLGLRGKEISLITIALMCSTIIIWAWQKTSLLTVFRPPQIQLHLSPGIMTSDPVISSLTLEQQVNAGKEHNLEDLDDLPDGISTIAFEEQTVHKQIVEAERNGSSESFSLLTQIDVKDKEIGKEEGSKPEATEVEGKIKQIEVVEGEQSLDAPVLIDPASAHTNSSISRSADKNEGCNLANGKWVVDEKRPLYSGFGCKQWLSGMWACRLTQRTDFAYEKLRWQPKACEMEEFEAAKFLKRMQHKTLAFVGDSLGRQQFQSLMCMATNGQESPDVIDVGEEYGLFQAPGNTRPNGWAYRFSSTNTTILYYWSASLCDIEPIDNTIQDTDYAMHLDRPPAFLRKYIYKFDVLVLNTGHHWNRGKLKANRWVMHVDGKPNTDRQIAMIWKAKNLTVHSIISWVNSQLPKYPGLKAFYRTISPRHFVGGEWNTGGSCNNTTPMSVGKVVLQDVSSDESAANAVKGTGVKLLDITAPSQLRDEGHISRFRSATGSGVQDCLHWCLPGVPDTWNEILFAQI